MPVGAPSELQAESGSFALTGKPISTRRLDACVTAFLLTGSTLEFGMGGTLMASRGAFFTAGDTVAFRRTPPALNAESMLFILDGYTSGGSRLLSAGSASYVMDSLPAAITPPPPAKWFGPGGACVCDCCLKPHVEISFAGANVEWTVSNADTATLTYGCNDDAETVQEITLIAGAASGTLPVGSGNCFYTIAAENECGPVSESVRNYATMQCGDCLHVQDEPPTRWGRLPPVIVTIDGTSAAPGFDSCGYEHNCPVLAFSTYLSCDKIYRRFRITSAPPSGCLAMYHSFADIQVFIEYRLPLYLFSSGVTITVVYNAFWYTQRGGSTVNHYPALTEIVPSTAATPWVVPDTIFSGQTYQNVWQGEIESVLNPLGNIVGIKCLTGQLSTTLTQPYTARCRNNFSGGTETCDARTCIPSLDITATWG